MCDVWGSGLQSRGAGSTKKGLEEGKQIEGKSHEAVGHQGTNSGGVVECGSVCVCGCVYTHTHTRTYIQLKRVLV